MLSFGGPKSFVIDEHVNWLWLWWPVSFILRPTREKKATPNERTANTATVNDPKIESTLPKISLCLVFPSFFFILLSSEMCVSFCVVGVTKNKGSKNQHAIPELCLVCCCFVFFLSSLKNFRAFLL